MEPPRSGGDAADDRAPDSRSSTDRAASDHDATGEATPPSGEDAPGGNAPAAEDAGDAERRPRYRPNWWPADEPWPPMGPPSWVRAGRSPWAGWSSDADARWNGRRRRRARDRWREGDPAWGPGMAFRPRHGFLWRIGCLFIVLAILAGGAGTMVAWLVGVGFGDTGTPFHYRVVGLAVLLAGGLAIVGLGRAVRRSAAPIDDVVLAARRVEAGDFSARIADDGPPELRAVARAFNSMAERLAETDAQRRSFLADVSHELRTPLTVIEGHIEGVLDGVYPPDDAHLGPVLEETRTLERLVDDLRTLALADAGALTLAREPTDLEDVISEAVAAARPSADAAHVELRRDVVPDLPQLFVDPVRIRGVLGNLLANAIRHTPAGGLVSVVATRTPDRRAVSVAVSDSGPGIEPELLPRVFERFAKGRGSRGSGLGLAIARDVIRAHGGTISAESAPGHGTTIRFELPVDTP